MCVDLHRVMEFLQKDKALAITAVLCFLAYGYFRRVSLICYEQFSYNPKTKKCRRSGS